MKWSCLGIIPVMSLCFVVVFCNDPGVKLEDIFQAPDLKQAVLLNLNSTKWMMKRFGILQLFKRQSWSGQTFSLIKPGQDLKVGMWSSLLELELY